MDPEVLKQLLESNKQLMDNQMEMIKSKLDYVESQKQQQQPEQQQQQQQQADKMITKWTDPSKVTVMDSTPAMTYQIRKNPTSGAVRKFIKGTTLLHIQRELGSSILL